MEFKETVIWSLINWKKHKSLKDQDTTIEALMPLVDALFPGIDYYSITGFMAVKDECLVPVLKKLFPALQTMPEEKITRTKKVEINTFLKSKGYEWQDSKKWKLKFNELLKAA